MNEYSVSDLYNISHGNKELLLEHLEALKEIFDDAIKELKNNNE